MKTQDTVLSDWQKAIDDFYSKADAKLDEVRDCKQQLEQFKLEILNQINNGQYYSDNKCIIISAPRIIIGNVTKDGTLKTGGGEVILKGTTLDLDGVGRGGNISLQAPVIRQQAVDPGIDGNEEVVYDATQSVISSQARSVIINSQTPKADKDMQGTFRPLPDKGDGVTVASEGGITLSAVVPAEDKKTAAEKLKGSLSSSIDTLKTKIEAVRKSLHDDVQDMDKIFDDEKKITADCDLTRANILSIDELNVLLRKKMPDFNKHLLEYAELVAKLAESNRQKANMADEAKSAVKSDYKDKFTGARLALEAEKIELRSIDGDGNWRTNEDAGIDLMANDIKLRSMVADEKGNIQLSPKDKKGRVTIQARNVSISTANIEGAEYEKGKLKKAKFPLEGNVTIRSKVINMEAVDMEQTDASGKLKETKLTAGSEIYMRANKVRVKTINEKGESVGKFSVNSQKVSVKATNIDGYKADVELDDQGNRKMPDKMQSKELTKDSEMLFVAENMHIGYKKDKMRSKNVYIAAEEKMVVGGKKEATFASDKANFILSDDAAKLIANGATTLSAGSGTTVKGATTFKGKVTGKDIEADNFKAGKSLKTPNISDGIAVPAPPEQGDKAKETKIPDSNQ